MDIHQYLPINEHFKIPMEKETKLESWTPFLRQLLVLSGAFTGLFITGLGMGATTVLIAQWQKEKNTDIITEEMSTWLTCSGFYSAPIWVLVWMTVSKQVGRKIPYGISTTIMLISFIIFYFSTTVKHLLISEILKGSGYATNLSVTILIFTEYSSPKYRGVFLTLKTASTYWGIWVGNAIGTFYHWKYIAVVAFVCFAHVIVAMVFWPESPLWLATKGRFNECAKTHRWLKGSGETSERELKNLIATQKEYLKKMPIKLSTLKQINDLARSISNRHFYKPLLISMIISQQITLSGKLSSSLYAMQLIKKMTKDESNAYTIMLILDGITVIGMYSGVIISRFVKRRNQAIITSIFTVLFLYIISLYFYLDYFKIIIANDIIVACLLTAYSVSIACGPLILTFTIYGEMIPTESRTMYTIISVMLSFLISATYLKTAPYVFNRLSMQATFLFYGISATIITICMYYFMPETKDKTLAEIEDSFRKNESTLELQRNRKLDLLNSVK